MQLYTLSNHSAKLVRKAHFYVYVLVISVIFARKHVSKLTEDRFFSSSFSFEFN